MSNLYEVVAKGGPLMLPLVGLSVASFACAFDRAVFWFQVLRTEDRVAHHILDAAQYSLTDARMIAEKASSQPIGRFMLAALKLNQPNPETFRLALETAGDEEFAKMRRGDKMLETAVAIAPLLGLLGTVTGLMLTFANLNVGGATLGAEQTTKAAAGIAEALTTTACGMVVAIIALALLRVSVTLQSQQMEYFSKIGGELELIYRQVWYEPWTNELAKAGSAQLSSELSVGS
ncbi:MULTISPECIES: MotA/TolQ/ExbB proton channel family protein [Leptolyngbya]|uniref:MotA/TolQ/ExbB proton channel family protein n=1 Tax=Leptolyngbya boryana CZ1 TaxID=3060204 RepID=A0AA97APP6_LEPBY|nr:MULTISPECIES: MotA/TolQ/ExbB proton channel family protein [Leptolyngbya]MBN8562887.1 MotA/TolQ/ExbB proton channel family protein [Leptolyngbya sp. UWPOB_LEPTO1]MCY6493664.1 MotA/TolQ/ExbB proton channel family protein [Leptolyngbya sp. GGD]WNZ46928.1 MotA/TolQ/ExbB proton channel family protein [Leptolyngbya boryana CZ1]